MIREFRLRAQRIVNSSRFLLVFVQFFSLVSISVALQAQPAVETQQAEEEEVSEADAKQITASVVLKAPGIGRNYFPQGSVDLGELKCGQAYVVNLTIRNDSESPIDFDSVYTGCKCRKFETRSRSIEALGTINAKLVVKTPPSSSPSIHYTFGAELKRNGESVAAVSCKSILAGILKVDAGSLLLDYDQLRNAPHSVAFIFSKPVSAENITVTVDEELKPFVVAEIGEVDVNYGFFSVIHAGRDLPQEDTATARRFLGPIIALDSPSSSQQNFAGVYRTED